MITDNLTRDKPSHSNRQNPLYDIAIIGGGIQGVGIAQAAAAAGYSVLLLERTAFGAGTSSKSSKLIHGGLRYLESGEFNLVRESLQERELLLTLAPQLVKRQQFYIPLYRNSRHKSWQLRIGLSLYSLLAGMGRESRFKHYDKQHLSPCSELQQHNLSSVYRYSDAQTDDRALTCAVAESARRLGATLRCPIAFQKAQWHDGNYLITAKTDDSIERYKSRCLINAAGPWANELAANIQPLPPMLDIELVQGTHLLYEQPISKNCYYLEAPQDGRVVFILPWQGGTMVGTTETLYSGHPDNCHALPEEIHYLQTVVEHYFPNYKQQPCGEFVGMRVLPKADSSPFSRSREMQLAINNNYLALYGGKLTGYRATAEKIVAYIEKMIGTRKAIADTSKLTL